MIRILLYIFVLNLFSFNVNAKVFDNDSIEKSEIGFDKLIATVSSKIVHFKWDVSHESRGGDFLIEKSIDKINWREVKQVKSIGEHDSRHTYQVSEINFAEGLNEYFRISLIEQNGDLKELDVIEINQPILTNMLVLPPQKKVNQSLVVSYDSMIESKGVLYVKDESGKIVYDKNMFFDEGYNRLELNLKKFVKGKYVVFIRDEFGNKISRSFNTYKPGRSKF